MIKNLNIVCVKGENLHPYILDLARLRIEVFKDYPYLYQGDMKYEMDYVQNYYQNNQSFMVLVFDNEQVVGASTAIPLEFESEEIKKPFLEHAIPLRDVFYLGESVLLKAYRGRGVYRYFFSYREKAAKEYDAKIAAFCAVKRPTPDSKQPPDYRPLDKLWQRFGYEKHPELCAQLEWKEIDEEVATNKSLVFWLKQL